LVAHAGLAQIGLVASAIGIGSRQAAFGGVLHLLDAALATASAGLAFGSLTSRSGRPTLAALRGMASSLPATTAIACSALLALGAVPPAGLFLSDLTILGAAFQREPAAGVALCLLLTMILIALAGHAARIVFWPRTVQTLPNTDEDAAFSLARGRGFGGDGLLLLIVVALGIHLPAGLATLLWQASDIVRGRA
jgi:hydrogenase-4 component F